jgi:hypothetical protein
LAASVVGKRARFESAEEGGKGGKSQKFGREPGPEDPVFFDPAKDEPELVSEDAITRDVVEAMGRVGLDPAYTYAYKKTGILVTEMNAHLFSKAERKAWDEAIADYERAHSAQGGH